MGNIALLIINFFWPLLTSRACPRGCWRCLSSQSRGRCQDTANIDQWEESIENIDQWEDSITCWHVRMYLTPLLCHKLHTLGLSHRGGRSWKKVTSLRFLVALYSSIIKSIWIAIYSWAEDDSEIIYYLWDFMTEFKMTFIQREV